MLYQHNPSPRSSRFVPPFSLIAAPLLALLLLGGCGEDTATSFVEVPTRIAPLSESGDATDLGYEVTLTRVDLASGAILFTRNGEIHTASLWQRVRETLVSTAHAHPGHGQGGEVTGEALGPWVLRFSEADGAAFATASLAPGAYDGADLSFVSAGEEHGVSPDDPLYGSSVYLEGEAEREGITYAFSASVGNMAGQSSVGIPFDASVDGSGVIELHVLVKNPFEEETLFDAIDFEALDTDTDGFVSLNESDEATNRLRRALLSHDFYLFERSNQ